jgi:hypothetical protein
MINYIVVLSIFIYRQSDNQLTIRKPKLNKDFNIKIIIVKDKKCRQL